MSADPSWSQYILFRSRLRLHCNLITTQRRNYHYKLGWAGVPLSAAWNVHRPASNVTKQHCDQGQGWAHPGFLPAVSPNRKKLLFVFAIIMFFGYHRLHPLTYFCKLERIRILNDCEAICIDYTNFRVTVCDTSHTKSYSSIHWDMLSRFLGWKVQLLLFFFPLLAALSPVSLCPWLIFLV